MSAVYAIAPEGCPEYLTAGKAYEVIEAPGSSRGFEVVDDDGDRIFCLWEGCAHVKGDWQRSKQVSA